MGSGCKPSKITQAQLGDKRHSECHAYGHIPHEKEAAVVWTRERKRRARALATFAQYNSKRGNVEKTTIKIDGYHHEGFKNEWNGGEGSALVRRSHSTGCPLRIWPAKVRKFSMC